MNTAESNPYRPPPEIEAEGVVFCDRSQMPTGTPIADFGLPGRPQTPQRLLFLPDQLVLDRGPSKSLVVITREAFARHCDVVVGSLARLINVRASERLVIPLPKEAMGTLRRWIEPVSRQVLARTLATRLRFGLPLGAVMLFLSLPIFTAHRDPFGIAWSAALFALSVLRRFVTHRGLLLGDALVWSLLFALNTRLLLVHGSLFTFVLALGAIAFTVGALRAFAFFGPPRPV